MFLNNIERKMLKPYIKSRIIDYKNMYYTTTIIIFSVMILINILAYFMTGNSSSGALNIGFIITLICFVISAIVITTKGEFKKIFAYPVNSKVYIWGNFIVLILGAGIFLITVSAIGLLEVLVSNIAKTLSDNVFIINRITPVNIVDGLFIAFTYVVLITSVFYILGLFSNRNKKIGAIIFGLFIALVIGTVYVRTISTSAYAFYFKEPSMYIFSIKAWITIIFIHIISYFLLKGREVQ